MKYMLVLRRPGTEGEPVVNGTVDTIMAAYGERLIRAGVLLAGERLEPGPGILVGPRTERVGPAGGPDACTFDEFWILQVASAEEALEWARRCPSSASIEVRRVREAGDHRGAHHGDDADGQGTSIARSSRPTT